MALTRAQVETLIIKRVGLLFTELSLDGTTVDGTNADLNDPIVNALWLFDETVSNPALVADADIDDIAADEYREFVDTVEVRCLETALQALTAVNITVGPRSEAYDQLGQRIEKAIERKRAYMAKEYGTSVPTPSAGYISLHIAEHDEE